MGTNGIGSCLLGYADDYVDNAVINRVINGSMSSLNPLEEVELAERLIALHPWADCTRFARCGGEIASIAVRIARATTDRSVVAICGYHGWHDWYLAANLGDTDVLDGQLLPGLSPVGVPKKLRGTTVAFHYNNFKEFDDIMSKYGDRLAAVIMEPIRHGLPAPGFLEHIRESTKKSGTMLIFDEMTIGFRFAHSGSHLTLGVNPDLAIYAKALGNGFPIAAVVGTRAAMEGAHISFIISTYWTESIGPTAACAVLDRIDDTDIPKYVASVGDFVKKCWRDNANKYALPLTTSSDECSCLSSASFKHEKALAMKTIYTQQMLKRGFLAPLSIYPTLAHNAKVLGLYASAIDEVFAFIADCVKNDKIEQSLDGLVAKLGFTRLN